MLYVCIAQVIQCYPGAILYPQVYLIECISEHCYLPTPIFSGDFSAILLDPVYTILANSDIVLYVCIGLNSAILVQFSIHG